MGVIPLQFMNGQSADSLGLTGKEFYNISGLSSGLSAQQIFTVQATDPALPSQIKEFQVRSRLDSKAEIDYFSKGGILHAALTGFLK
jgi:aconitate hydratase